MNVHVVSRMKECVNGLINGSMHKWNAERRNALMTSEMDECSKSEALNDSHMGDGTNEIINGGMNE